MLRMILRPYSAPGLLLIRIQLVDSRRGRGKQGYVHSLSESIMERIYVSGFVADGYVASRFSGHVYTGAPFKPPPD